MAGKQPVRGGNMFCQNRGFEASSNLRNRLFSTASAGALIASLGFISRASADDLTAPRLTVEIGGGYNWVGGPDTTYFVPLQGTNFPVKHGNGYDFEGRATFQNAASDYVFTANVQYGRSSHRGAPVTGSYTTEFGTYTFAAQDGHSENHLAIDFEVGQDFGLGLFGGSSVLSLGVRYAHFDAKTAISFSTTSKYGTSNGTGRIARKFDGLGPIAAWDEVNALDDSFSLEYGADVAVLFGTQNFRAVGGFDGDSSSYNAFRSRSTTVPTVGAYAAIAYHFAGPNSKISLGYRVDSYFGVLDGGFSAHDDMDRTFHGPYLRVGFSTN